MSNWQTVFTTSNPHQAEIVKDVLTNAGLTAVIFNKKDSSYQLGSIEVKVSPDSVMPSLKIIEEEINFDHD